MNPFKPNVLVTGGAGFIGSRVVKAAAGLGWGVRVLDDLSTGTERSLGPLLEAEKVHLHRGSVTDAEAVEQCLPGIDLIIHLAALVSVPLSVAHPRESFTRNVVGSFTIFDAARRSTNPLPIVYASSAAVYGDVSQPPISESSPLAPMSPYACDKVYLESLARTFLTTYRLCSTGLRLFNVYGPGQRPESHYSGVITRFVATMKAGGAVTIFGDGAQTRDFVHVDDVSAAFLSAARRLLTINEPDATILNIGSGLSTSVNDLFEILARASGYRLSPEQRAEIPGSVRHSQANIQLASETLGWTPGIDLTRGLTGLIGNL